jgi:hypothetical protein
MTNNQEAWLQALESDEFKQTTGQLQRGDGFCCLGVACVVAEKAGITVRRYLGVALDGSTLHDQPEVHYWLGLRSETGHPRSHVSCSLIGLNDRGKTFKEIAQFIRANPEEYFVNTESGSLAPSPGK